LRRISVVVVSVLLMVALAATMAALPTFAEENGNSGTKDGFGTAASQIATDKGPNTGTDGKGGLGEHSRDPDQDGVKGERREGIGNVAREDGGVGEHGCKQLAAMGGDCSEGPGKGK
jgi:hypothetical protein